jgi:hypothetical protein
MALPISLFYGCKVKVRVPPEDCDDSVVASESDELPRSKSNNVFIPETDSDEGVYSVTAPSSTFVKRKRKT